MPAAERADRVHYGWWIYDRSGSYAVAFAVNAVLPCLALALVALALRPPAGRVDETRAAA